MLFNHFVIGFSFVHCRTTLFWVSFPNRNNNNNNNNNNKNNNN